MCVCVYLWYLDPIWYLLQSQRTRHANPVSFFFFLFFFWIKLKFPLVLFFFFIVIASFGNGLQSPPLIKVRKKLNQYTINIIIKSISKAGTRATFCILSFVANQFVTYNLSPRYTSIYSPKGGQCVFPYSLVLLFFVMTVFSLLVCLRWMSLFFPLRTIPCLELQQDWDCPDSPQDTGFFLPTYIFPRTSSPFQMDSTCHPAYPTFFSYYLLPLLSFLSWCYWHFKQCRYLPCRWAR